MTTTETTGTPQIQTQTGGSESMPALPTAVTDAQTTRELMFTLRHFYLGDPSAKDQLEPVGEGFLPALLSPFRDDSKLRYAYPLALFPPKKADGNQEASELTAAITDYLQQSLESFAKDAESARILRDNLSWVERHIRQHLRENEAPLDAAPTIEEAGHALQKHLGLKAADRDRLQADLNKLVAAVPEGVQLLGYGRFAAIHLLNHAIRSRVIPRRTRFNERIQELIRGLKNLLEVEWAKSDESIEPRMIRDSIGTGGMRFDADALSSVMDHSRGVKAMTPEQRQRIKTVLKTLQTWQEDPILVRFVHLGKLDTAWAQETPAFESIVDPDPCAKSMEVFDEQAASLTEVFSAARIAELEIERIYDPKIHDPWFESFHWEAFSQDELLLVPAVIALESADRISGPGQQSFSRLLNSGRPVHILVRVQPHNNPGALEGENPFQSYRTELGYLGIGHRQAVVSQSSPARHVHLLSGYLSALDATRTSLHVVNTGLRMQYNTAASLNAWLVAGAALEGRAHPFFHINPAAGDTSAARMDFSENPQPAIDWPLHPFEYRDENGTAVSTELPFTFADYALLIGRLRDHFRFIPPEVESSALVPVEEYLNLDEREAYKRVPFIWAVDSNAILRRLIVSRQLILACRDRLNYWRTLQELAGVRNRYVELAVEKAQAEEQAKSAAERETLLAQHHEELERVRNESAGEAMQRLAQVLLSSDFSTVPSFGAAPRDLPTAKPDTVAEQEDVASQDSATAVAEEEEEMISFDEPFIDSLLCTSCNDCLAINPLLFIYNENKQAFIGDLKAGTFAELVQAAEACPAHCIHPGKPLNSDEPDLDELIERAAPFNSI